MERGAKSSENKLPDSGGVVKPQAAEELHSKIRIIGGYQDNNLDCQFGGGGGGCGVGSGGGNEVHKVGVGILSSRGVGEIFSRSRSTTTTGTNRQLLDIFSNKSPGVGMAAAGVGFPFTFAQRKELERQAMIYKYMVSSVPVPADLLFASGAVVDSSASSLRAVGLSKPGDAEPGRCKRTDGKKWRCSRDVAPHQKYCERHLHRGRPRSRKPVEIKTNAENYKKTRTELVDTPKTSSASQQSLAKNDQSHALSNGKTDLTISTLPAYRGTNRESGLIMGRAEQQPWQHLIEPSNIRYTNEISSIYSSGGAFFHQDYMEPQPVNLSSYSNFPAPDIEVPTGFIDAWSIDNINNGNVESSFQLNRDSLSPSLDLSISTSLGSALDQEMSSIHMGGDNEHRIKDSSWLPLARGGPLAEVLHPGSAIPTSPHDSLSTPATTVSSPSGVLHRPMFSHSDGSVCNSPTFTTAPPESAFHRFN